MPFGHIFVDAEQAAVVAAVHRHLAAQGFAKAEMRPELHPRRMKQVHESQVRLLWVSPRLGRWTGLFEFRYYNNEMRERWGLTDDALAAALSKDLAATVWRMEVMDNAGFWLYSRLEGGEEKEGGAWQDTPATRSSDPAHPRYALNRIIEREGLKNIGLGYEHIPGPMVRPIENVPQSATGIEGYEGFAHLAYAKEPLKPL
jgi:hypothetical protein